MSKCSVIVSNSERLQNVNTDDAPVVSLKSLAVMIIEFVEFCVKPGKEKTVHKILRANLETLHKEGYRGLTYHSYRNANNKLQFVQLNVFDSPEVKERFENSTVLKEHHDRLLSIVEGQIRKNIFESFEIYHANNY